MGITQLVGFGWDGWDFVGNTRQIMPAHRVLFVYIIDIGLHMPKLYLDIISI